MATVLRDMNRTERFSGPSSGLNEKQSLSQRVATMTSLKEQLLNSLKDLSYEDHTNFLWLLQFTLFQRGLPYISWGRLQWEDWVDILVETMVETCGQQAVEVTGKVFMDMNWPDLVQGLSDTSSGPEAAGSSAEVFDVKTTEGEKHSVDEHWPSLIQKVEFMASAIELLLETMADLSETEFKNFKEVFQSQSDFFNPQSDILFVERDRQNAVFLMVQTYGQKSVESTKKILKEMKRADLVQRLSYFSTRHKNKGTDEHVSALIQKVATMAAVEQLLLETMNVLSYKELEKFKEFLQLIVYQKNLPDISSKVTSQSDKAYIVHLMVQTYGQQSVEVIREIFMNINRTDLVKRLSKPSPGFKEKHSVEEPRPSLFERREAIAADKQNILETLKNLSSEELEEFKWCLKFTYFQKSLPKTPWSQVEWTDSADALVDLMVESLGQQSVEVTKEVLIDMNRADLVERLSEISSGPKDKHPSKLFKKEVTLTSFKEEIYETLQDLHEEEFEYFKWHLQQPDIRQGLPGIRRSRMENAGRAQTVDLMVQTYGEQSVEVAREVLVRINRNDLMQTFSAISSGSKETHPSKPSQKDVAMTISLEEKLLETLEDLNRRELQEFQWLLQQPDIRKDLPGIPKSRMENADRAQTVELMVQTYGEQSVEVTREVLEKIRRIDLVQRLTDISSGSKEKHSSKLSKKDVAMTISLEEKLLETLEDLNRRELQEFQWLLQQPDIRKDLPGIPKSRMENADRAQTVDLMVQTYGEQSVEVTREVLEKIRRIDLVQRLTDISSGSKEKHSSKLSKKKEMLSGTIEDLSHWELEEFKWYLQNTTLEKRLSGIPVHSMKNADHCDIVNLMVEHYGEHSVEVTRKILVKINRNDMVQKLSYISSGSQEKHPSKPCLKEVTMTSFKITLLNTFEDLCGEDFAKVKWYLQQTAMRKGLPGTTKSRMENAGRVQTVDLLVDTYGEKSVEVTRKVLKMINRNDMVQKLSYISSGSQEKHPSKPCLKEVTMTSFKITLLNTFEDLCGEDFAKVKWYLQQTAMRKGLPGITKSRMENAGRAQTVDLLVDTYGEKSVEVTREVLKMINRNDLVETLTIISSGSKGPSRSLALVGGGSIMQASIDWTILHPEVISSDADEAPQKSVLIPCTVTIISILQSESGNFECSVSGLRWVCTEKVSLKYQFCSSEEHMDRIESMQYMPAGTLMNITVIHGKLDEVYMQHWICIDDNPTLLDQFAVLHIDDCGDVVEKVSEVTPTHVKLSNSDFSLKMVLVKAGIPVKINCNVLIYKTSTPSFTLHVYLIPPDKGLHQELNKIELDDGYKLIRWPNPEKSLKMHDSFILTADLKGARIYPKKLMLRYRNPNFFNVIIENPDMNFKIHLTHENEDEPVWTCEIQTAAGSSDEASGVKTTEAVKHSVDEQHSALIQKAAKATTVRERLLIMLQDLGQFKFEDFMWYLKDEVFMSVLGLPCFLTSQLENKSRPQLVDLLLQKYMQQTVEVTKRIFTKIDRNDLVQMLSDTSSGPEASGSST